MAWLDRDTGAMYLSIDEGPPIFGLQRLTMLKAVLVIECLIFFCSVIAFPNCQASAPRLW